MRLNYACDRLCSLCFQVASRVLFRLLFFLFFLFSFVFKTAFYCLSQLNKVRRQAFKKTRTTTREIFQIFYNGVLKSSKKRKRKRRKGRERMNPRAYPSIFRGNSLDACKSSDCLNSVMKGAKVHKKLLVAQWRNALERCRSEILCQRALFETL